MSFSANNVRRFGAALLLILFAGLIVYGNVYRVPFHFDDGKRIVDNPEIRSSGNFMSLKALLRPRAIVDLTFSWNYRLGGLDVFGYHLVNVIIHILNGFLVFALSFSILGRLSGGEALPR